GALRMQGLLSLLNRNQMILGWTWRSMLGGEEQYLYGLLGHDGVPNSNYFEYQKLAEDLSKLAPFAFPYLPDPDVAVAYHYDSSWVNQYSSSQFQQSYKNTMTEVNRIFYEKNRDYNVVDLRNLKKDYKLIIIPGHIVMEPEAADTIRNYVKAGGNVIMTAYSATVDETGKVFGTPRPGYLEDVFGIRVAGFYRTDMEWTFSKDGVISEEQGSRRELLRIEKGEEDFLINARYYEVLERNAAASYAEFKSKNMCAVSVNQYGSGKAFYMAPETDREMLGWLLECLTAELGLQKGLSVPEGIQARKIAENQYFYVNTTPGPVRVPLDRDGKGILSGKDCCEELLLGPYEGELLVTGKQMGIGDVLEEI
ncbi:MAG: beta-galactosidase trimerization domain-containing protein, partial [Lacrimispora sp.]